MRTIPVRAALGLGGSLVAGFLSRGVSAAEAPQRGPPSPPPSPPPSAQFADLERRVASLESEQRARPVVVCGPSGVGKGTLLGKLMKEYPDDFGFSVSHTTRQPRPGEQNGVHYHFCDKADMEAMIADGGFIEYAHVHANIYGTSIAAVRARHERTGPVFAHAHAQCPCPTSVDTTKTRACACASPAHVAGARGERARQDVPARHRRAGR